MVFLEGDVLAIVLSSDLELTSLLISFNFLIAAEIVKILISSDLLFREKHLSPVFEIFHQSFGLEVGIETHGWADFLGFLTRSHDPVCPLRLRRHTIYIAILCYRLQASLFVC